MLTIPLYVISFGLTQIDFNLLWRYFNWANQVTAVIALLVSTRYLYLKDKNYLVTLIPATFMLYAVFVYIVSQPIGLGLELGLPTYTLSLIGTGLLLTLFWSSGKKQKTGLSSDSSLLNDHRSLSRRVSGAVK